MNPNSAIVNCSALGNCRLLNSLLPLLVWARRIVREGPMSHNLLCSGHYPFGGLGLSVVRAAIFLLSSTVFASSSWALPPEHGEGGMAWDASNRAEAFDPADRGARNPAKGAYSATLAQTSVGVRRSALNSPETTGNRDFALTVPVVRLPGRGLDLALDLNYNSRVWRRIGGEIVFSADGGDLAAGWRLGFGQLVNFGPNDCWLIEADGAKHTSAPIGPAGIYAQLDRGVPEARAFEPPGRAASPREGVMWA